MNKKAALLLSTILAFYPAACGNDNGGDQRNIGNTPAGSYEPSAEDVSPAATKGASGEDGTEISEDLTGIKTDTASSKILIAYFSVPEDVDITGVDAIAGASVVVQDGEKLGNTEYVAGLIQQTIGGDLFRIETGEPYPLDHGPLVDQAAEEQDDTVRHVVQAALNEDQQLLTGLALAAGGLLVVHPYKTVTLAILRVGL